MYSKEGNLLFLLIHVDDMVLTGNNSNLIATVTEFLTSHFKIKDLGPLNFFLGIQVTRSADGIFINQQKYIADILKEFDYLQSKSAIVPMH